MKDERLYEKELLAKAALSENAVEAGRILYQVAGICGEFPRRLIFDSENNKAQVLSPEGELGYFPESQLNILKEKSGKGELSAGGGKCLLLPITIEGTGKTAYWTIYADLENRALGLAPDLTLILSHIERLEKAARKEALLGSCLKLTSIIPALFISNDISTVLKTVFPLIQDVYAPSIAVFGIKRAKGVEAAVLEKGGFSGVRFLEGDLLPIGTNVETILTEEDQVLKTFSSSLKLPPLKGALLAARFYKQGRFLFVLLGDPEKKPAPVFDLLRLFLAVLSASTASNEERELLIEENSRISEAFKMLAERNGRMDKALHSLPTGVLLLTLSGGIEF